MGVSFGGLQTIPLATTIRYFPKNKKSISCLLQLFLGVGAFLAIKVFQSHFSANPLSIYFDEKDLEQSICHQFAIRESFRVLAFYVFFLGLLACVLVTKPEGKWVLVRIGVATVEENMLDFDILAYQHEMEVEQRGAPEKMVVMLSYFGPSKSGVGLISSGVVGCAEPVPGDREGVRNGLREIAGGVRERGAGGGRGEGGVRGGDEGGQVPRGLLQGAVVQCSVWNSVMALGPAESAPSLRRAARQRRAGAGRPHHAAPARHPLPGMRVQPPLRREV